MKVLIPHPDTSQHQPARTYFHAAAPNQLWVVGITDAPTRKSMAYTTFIRRCLHPKIIA